MWPGIGAVRVWRRNLESWKRYALPFFVAALGEPIFYLIGIGYGLGRFVINIEGVPYATFLAPGIVAFAAMNTATFETTIGAYTRMAEQHTYTAILATPCSVADIVAGDVLWGASKSVIAVAFVLLMTTVLGLVHPLAALALLPLGFAIGLMFGTLGMVVTSRAPSYDFFNYYYTLVFSVMFLFSGVFYPVDSLPPWAGWIAWVLPLTHAVNVARAFVDGTTPLLRDLAWMAAATVGAYVLAERLVRR